MYVIASYIVAIYIKHRLQTPNSSMVRVLLTLEDHKLSIEERVGEWWGRVEVHMWLAISKGSSTLKNECTDFRVSAF